MKPLYKHDCDKCKFIGNVFVGKEYRVEADLWKQCQTYDGTYIGFILRYSDVEDDYSSGPAEFLAEWLV